MGTKCIENIIGNTYEYVSCNWSQIWFISYCRNNCLSTLRNIKNIMHFNKPTLMIYREAPDPTRRK